MGELLTVCSEGRLWLMGCPARWGELLIVCSEGRLGLMGCPPASPVPTLHVLSSHISSPVKVEVAQSCLFVTLWAIQSMEFSRPEYWSG